MAHTKTRPGPMPKHPTKIAERMSLVPGGRVEPPKPERQWLKVTRVAYEEFWESDVAAAVTVVDLSTLRRLFNLRDDHERLVRSARKTPLVTGSQGQLVENPLAKRADRIMSEITRLEGQFGMTPVSRLRLQSNVLDVSRSVAGLSADFSADDLQIIDMGG